MTCIVGLERAGKVYLGGDIQGTGRNIKTLHTQPKVFNRNGVLFGYTTSYRFGQILEFDIKDPVVPDNKGEIYRWLITVLVPDIKASLKQGGLDGGGQCLIGIKGQLWELQNDFSVLRSTKGYAAVGSGYEYALGSLYTQVAGDINSGDPRALIETAIMAAGTFSPSVGTEAVIHSV